MIKLYIINRSRKLEISTAPTKAKSRETVDSQALTQKKIGRQALNPFALPIKDNRNFISRLIYKNIY